MAGRGKGKRRAPPASAHDGTAPRARRPRVASPLPSSTDPPPPRPPPPPLLTGPGAGPLAPHPPSSSHGGGAAVSGERRHTLPPSSSPPSSPASSSSPSPQVLPVSPARPTPSDGVGLDASNRQHPAARDWVSVVEAGLAKQQARVPLSLSLLPRPSSPSSPSRSPSLFPAPGPAALRSPPSSGAKAAPPSAQGRTAPRSQARDADKGDGMRAVSPRTGSPRTGSRRHYAPAIASSPSASTPPAREEVQSPAGTASPPSSPAGWSLGGQPGDVDGWGPLEEDDMSPLPCSPEQPQSPTVSPPPSPSPSPSPPPSPSPASPGGRQSDDEVDAAPLMTTAAGAVLPTQPPSSSLASPTSLVPTSTLPGPAHTLPAHTAALATTSTSAAAPPERFLWSIDRFNLLRSPGFYRHCSPDFTLDGRTWRMLLFPSGNVHHHKPPRSDDAVSLYVQRLAGPGQGEAAPPYRFSFTALPPARPPSSAEHGQVHPWTKEFTHRFTNEEHDRGFSHWLEVKRLPAYLDNNGALTIRVGLQRQQEAAQRPGETDSAAASNSSERTTAFVGLKNQGATCQCTALTHALTHSLTHSQSLSHPRVDARAPALRAPHSSASIHLTVWRSRAPAPPPTLPPPPPPPPHPSPLPLSFLRAPCRLHQRCAAGAVPPAHVPRPPGHAAASGERQRQRQRTAERAARARRPGHQLVGRVHCATDADARYSHPAAGGRARVPPPRLQENRRHQRAERGHRPPAQGPRDVRALHR